MTLTDVLIHVNVYIEDPRPFGLPGVHRQQLKGRCSEGDYINRAIKS